MKFLLMGLAALMIAPSVGADEIVAPYAAPVQATSDSKSAAKAPASKKKRPRDAKRRLPRGDLRHCLELKSNEEIIKCSESR